MNVKLELTTVDVGLPYNKCSLLNVNVHDSLVFSIEPLPVYIILHFGGTLKTSRS
jgi:hypothetical protein